MEFVSSCQTDDLTWIKGDDMTMLLPAFTFVSSLLWVFFFFYVQYTHKLTVISKCVRFGIIQIGNNFKISLVQPAQDSLRKQGCLGIYLVRSWKTWKDEDSNNWSGWHSSPISVSLLLVFPKPRTLLFWLELGSSVVPFRQYLQVSRLQVNSGIERDTFCFHACKLKRFIPEWPDKTEPVHQLQGCLCIFWYWNQALKLFPLVKDSISTLNFVSMIWSDYQNRKQDVSRCAVAICVITSFFFSL